MLGPDGSIAESELKNIIVQLKRRSLMKVFVALKAKIYIGIGAGLALFSGQIKIFPASTDGSNTVLRTVRLFIKEKDDDLCYRKMPFAMIPPGQEWVDADQGSSFY